MARNLNPIMEIRRYHPRQRQAPPATESIGSKVAWVLRFSFFSNWNRGEANMAESVSGTSDQHASRLGKGELQFR
ncbi:MAG TPA: hypothetical protein VIY96_05585, partial [Thermoanaerobaculia bacterium]